MPAASDVDHKNKLLKRLKGGMNIHTEFESTGLDSRVNSQAPVSLSDFNTNPFRSLRAHRGEKHLHTNTNTPPHTHAEDYGIWLARFLMAHESEICRRERAAIDLKYISKLSSETMRSNP